MKSMKTLLLGGALVVLAAGVPAAAQAQAAPILPPAASKLLLSVVDGAALTTATKAVTLTCDPDGGTHPKPAAACDRLRKVNGAFTRLRPQPGTVCPAVYRPVTAMASGTWRGKAVSFKKTFGNQCELNAATHPIFDF